MCGYLIGKQQRLIEFTLSQTARMQRDGDDEVCIHILNQDAGSDPIFNWALPHHRGAVDKEDIASKYNMISGTMDQHIPAGVSRPNFNEMYQLVAYPQVELTVKGACWRGETNCEKIMTKGGLTALCYCWWIVFRVTARMVFRLARQSRPPT